MTRCRGCGADIPPRLRWPEFCGPACVELAVERAIKRAMARPPGEHALPRPKSPRPPLFCEWCETLLPSDRSRWCSHDHRRAWQTRARGQDDDIPEPLWRELEALAPLPRAPTGALLRLETQFQRPANTLKVHLNRVRNGYRACREEP